MRSAAEGGGLRAALSKAARETAKMLQENFGNPRLGEVVGQGVTGDPTRVIDLMAEDYLIDLVRASGLSAWVLSEERGLYKLADRPELLILADPLDGSLNYSVGIPIAGVSIAAYEFDRPRFFEPAYGVVVSVFGGEVFEIAGGEVLVNGAKPSGEVRGRGIICVHTTNPSTLSKVRKLVLDRGGRPRLRALGAASLEVAYTAVGRIEYYINDVGGLRSLDIAVGLSMARKRGLRVVTRPSIDRVSPYSVDVLDEVWVAPSELA